MDLFIDLTTAKVISAPKPSAEFLEFQEQIIKDIEVGCGVPAGLFQEDDAADVCRKFRTAAATIGIPYDAFTVHFVRESQPAWIDRRCGLMPAEHPRGG